MNFFQPDAGCFDIYDYIITLQQNNGKPWVRNATALVNLVFSPCHVSEVANEKQTY